MTRLRQLLPLLFNGAALCLLAGVLAHWTWQWWPRPPGATEPDKAPAGAAFEARALARALGFIAGGATQSAAARSASSGGFELAGLALSQAGDHQAVIRSPAGRAQPYRQGDELAPSIRVKAIYADQVVLEQAGQDIRLRLRMPTAGAESSPAAGPAMAAPQIKVTGTPVAKANSMASRPVP